MSVIDFHTHILPGIDDGSRNRVMSQEMLSAAKAQGIKCIVATPHFYADRMTIDKFVQDRKKAQETIQHNVRRSEISLVSAAEVAFFPGMCHAEELKRLCFFEGKSDLMMLEMPFRAWSSSDLTEVDRLLYRGFRLIIAHLDRFYQFQTDKKIIPALLDMPVIIQINTEALLNRTSLRRTLKLFEKGQAHILGSDCHNLSSRPENMASARRVLAKELGNGILRNIDANGISLFQNR